MANKNTTSTRRSKVRRLYNPLEYDDVALLCWLERDEKRSKAEKANKKELKNNDNKRN